MYEIAFTDVSVRNKLYGVMAAKARRIEMSHKAAHWFLKTAIRRGSVVVKVNHPTLKGGACSRKLGWPDSAHLHL